MVLNDLRCLEGVKDRQSADGHRGRRRNVVVEPSDAVRTVALVIARPVDAGPLGDGAVSQRPVECTGGHEHVVGDGDRRALGDVDVGAVVIKAPDQGLRLADTVACNHRS